jgi:hypothetical protein
VCVDYNNALRNGALSLSGVPNLTTAGFPVLSTPHASLFLGHTGLADLHGFSTLRSWVQAVRVYFNANLAIIGWDVDGVEAGLFGIGTEFAAPAVAGGKLNTGQNEGCGQQEE